MQTFKELTAEEIKDNPFKTIGKDWMIVSAENQGGVNGMTASWGGFGVMWNKNVAFVVIRPQRYTKEFVDKAEGLSLTFFDESYRKTLNYFGTVSGRDEDKISNMKLTVKMHQGLPYYEEARMAVFCKKLFAQPYEESSFLDKSILTKWYPENDLHTLYICEITGVLVK